MSGVTSNMKIPIHLKQCITNVFSDEKTLTGDIKCALHDFDKFAINFIGNIQLEGESKIIKVVKNNGNFFFIISIQFDGCEDRVVLLDNRIHGWNGFMNARSGIINTSSYPKYNTWNCESCNGKLHTGTLQLFSKGKEDFISEVEKKYDENLWNEAFSWFKMDIKCGDCGIETNGFIDYETM